MGYTKSECYYVKNSDTNDYFRLQKRTNLGKSIKDYDIDYSKYHIYKGTDKFREVTYDEFIKFKYAQYILFHKDIYSNVEINESLELLKPFDRFLFLHKPLPPLSIIKKIKVIDGI